MLQTLRLKLRQWQDEDLPYFAALNADSRVMEHFPAPLSKAESNALADWIRQRIDTNGYGLWAVEIVGGAPFIGFVGLSAPRFQTHFTPCVEIGWRLSFEHWGKGYATKAATAAARYGFQNLGLDEIVSFTVPANLKSQQVMLRIGMTHNPEDDFDHPKLATGHPLQRQVLYRLKKSDAMFLT